MRVSHLVRNSAFQGPFGRVVVCQEMCNKRMRSGGVHAHWYLLTHAHWYLLASLPGCLGGAFVCIVVFV
jgi:hypothetical protein